MYKVLKKDGTVQDFSWNKVIASMLSSGASQEDADKVAQSVELWLSTVADDGFIKSYDLHMKIIEILNSINSDAAVKFEAYEKPIPQ